MDPKDRLARVFSSEERIIVLSPWVTITPEDLEKDLEELDPESTFCAKDMALILDRRVTKDALNSLDGNSFEGLLMKWAAKGFDVIDVSEEGEDGPGTHAKVYIGDDVVLIGSLNLTRNGINRFLRGKEILVEPKKEDKENVKEYVKRWRKRGRTLAVSNRELNLNRWRTFIIKYKNDKKVVLKPTKSGKISNYKIPIKENNLEAKGFVFDGRLYGLEHNEWRGLRIEDYTNSIENNVHQSEVERVLMPFGGLRIWRIDEEHLKLVRVKNLEPINDNVEKYLNETKENIKERFKGKIKEIKLLWGIYPMIKWLSYENGRMPYILWRKELLYVNFENVKYGIVRYIEPPTKSKRETIRIINEQFIDDNGEYSVDIGILETTGGSFIPVLAKAPKTKSSGESR